MAASRLVRPQCLEAAQPANPSTLFARRCVTVLSLVAGPESMRYNAAQTQQARFDYAVDVRRYRRSTMAVVMEMLLAFGSATMLIATIAAPVIRAWLLIGYGALSSDIAS